MNHFNASPGKITLLDGPGENKSFHVQRAPVFVRAVNTPDNVWDVLDLPEDTPTDTEEIHVYRQAGWVHVRANNRKDSGFVYTYVHVPIDGTLKAVLRSTQRWREWTKLAYEELERSAAS